MNGAVNAQRNGNGKRDNGGAEIQQHRIEHRSGNNINHITLIACGISEIALKQTVKAALHIRPETHPARVSLD